VTSIADTFVTLLPETSKIAPGVKAAFREIDKEAFEAGRRWAKEIDRGLKSGDHDVEIDADTKQAERKVEQLDREISRRTAHIKIDVDKSNIGAVTRDVERAVGATSQAMDSGAKSASVMAGGVGELGSSLGAITRIGTPLAIIGLGATLVELGGVAASAAQGIALLPGVVGGAAAAFGTLKLATQGFGDAMDSIRDPEKFAEALQALSPAAQQAAIAIQQLMPAFDRLKNATQDAFFAGVGQQLNQLVNQFLPTIQTATTGIATAFNQMFAGVANQLMTPETQGAIQGFLANITTAFQALAPAAAPLTQAFATLANAGSSFLPQLASAAADAATSFAQFIEEARASGDLSKFMGEGLDTLKQLGDGAIALAGAFMQLAPIGQAILPDIVSLLKDIQPIMPAIGAAAVLLGVSFGPVTAAVEGLKATADLAGTAFDKLKPIIMNVGNAVIPVFNQIGQAVSDMLGPIRAAAKLVGVDIPEFKPVGPISFGSTGNGTPGVNRTAIQTSLPTAGIDPFTGAAVPNTARAAGGGIGGAFNPGLSWQSTRVGPGNVGVGGASGSASSAATAPPYFDPSLWQVGSGSSGSSAMPSGMDSALLANVPAGSYSKPGSGAWDLTKGLGDCSSAIEDLINMMQGRSTEGRSMATGNEAQWLTEHGFLPTNQAMPGTFQVGFNNHHTQATLPGGTNFNWGSDAAAATGGVNGSGAWDPAFSQHYYLPNGAMPQGGALPGMPGAAPGVGGQVDQTKVFDADSAVMRARSNLESDRLRVLELEKQGNASQRELLDARASVNEGERTLQSAEAKAAEARKGTIKDKTKAASSTGGEQLGQDILSGIMGVFGFGDIFKDPTQFGLFKILKGVMGLKFADDGQGGSGGGGGGIFDGLLGGGGGGGLGGILSSLPQAFGDLNVGGPQQGPGQFVAGMNGIAGSPAGGLVPAGPKQAPGAPGVGGSYINDFRGANFGHDPKAVQNQVNSAGLQHMRQPLRNLPVH
jgi:hypothetical protein